MKLKRSDLLEKVGLTSVAAVIDEDLPTDGSGNMVALVLYSPGGNVVYLHKEGYPIFNILVAGETFVGETLNAHRYKVFKVRVAKQTELVEFIKP